MADRTDSRGQKTVLIVEGPALLRRTMRELLQDAFPGCNFLDVADGASALEACNAYAWPTTRARAASSPARYQP